MNLVPIETPAPGVPATGEALELLDAPLGVIAAGESLQVVADQLIKALAEGVRFLAGACDQLLINR